MRRIVLTGLILFSVQFVQAQINGITETGDEVVLFDDGTWKYVHDSVTEISTIPVIETEFLKDKKSTFLVKSKKLNVGIWINPKAWTFSKGTEADAYEFQFEKKSGDLYAMLITEKIQVPLDVLKGIALTNAQSVSPDIKVIKEEYRTINGIKVFAMQMSGTIQGMRITYYGYYYSNSKGTMQLLTYTGENLFDDYLEDIELFINGLIEY